MESTLVLFAHPALQKSRANRALVAGIREIEGVTVNDLYERYPDFDIDVDREKALLEEATRVVWQYPLYWYSTPSLVKEWFDVVLQYGWAYGDGGTALAGKRASSVVTTGAPREAYGPDGHNGHTIEEFQLPVSQTARLCGMTWEPSLVFYDALHLEDRGLKEAVAAYREFLQATD